MANPVKMTHDRIWFGYSDLCVILSSTIRSAWNYYRDLQEYSPEKLLGYDILLTSPERNLQGYAIRQFYADPFLDFYEGSQEKLTRAIEQLMWSKLVYS